MIVNTFENFNGTDLKGHLPDKDREIWLQHCKFQNNSKFQF